MGLPRVGQDLVTEQQQKTSRWGMLLFLTNTCNICNWSYISGLHFNVPSHAQSFYFTKSCKPDSITKYPNSVYIMFSTINCNTNKTPIFQENYIYQESHGHFFLGGIGGLKLLILCDEFSSNNCFLGFVIAWWTFGSDGWKRWLWALKDLQISKWPFSGLVCRLALHSLISHFW